MKFQIVSDSSCDLPKERAQELGVDARVVEAQLRGGDIAIYARRYNLHQGVFSLDPRTVAEGEMALIVARLKEIADHAKD